MIEVPLLPATAVGSLAALGESMAATGMMVIVREAWDRADDDAKRALANGILHWATQNIERLTYQHREIMTMVAGVLGPEMMRKLITPEQEADFVKALHGGLMDVLTKKDRHDSTRERIILEALTAASRARLGELAAEQAVEALRGAPEFA